MKIEELEDVKKPKLREEDFVGSLNKLPTHMKIKRKIAERQKRKKYETEPNTLPN